MLSFASFDAPYLKHISVINERRLASLNSLLSSHPHSFYLGYKVYTEVSSDPRSPWRRDTNDGTFWMVFSDFVRLFTRGYLCRVFPDEEYRQYCVHGKHEMGGGFCTTKAAQSAWTSDGHGNTTHSWSFRAAYHTHYPDQATNDLPHIVSSFS